MYLKLSYAKADELAASVPVNSTIEEEPETVRENGGEAAGEV